MCEEPQPAPQVAGGSAHGSPPAHAFFSQSKQFTVIGGTFTNIIQATPGAPPNFRMIPMGDLDLRHEVRQKAGSIVTRRRRVKSSERKVYAARIHGSNTCTMAIFYQGYNAEERWRTEIMQYSNLRHPNILQLYGIANTGTLHAVIFHDDLVPHLDFWQQYDASHVSQVFFWVSLDAQLSAASQYISSVGGRDPHWSEYTAWIRISTGVLSIELTPPESWTTALDYYHSDFQPSSTSLLTSLPMSEIISSLSLKDYHHICDRHLSRDRNFTAPTNTPVKLGSICHASGSEFNKSFEVAFSSNFRVIDDGWLTEDPTIQDHWFSITFEEGTSILENGWIRVNSACVVEEYRRRVYCDGVCKGWLAQACHIFNSLDIKSNLEDYVLIYAMECCLQLLGPIENLCPGYLFLCPFAKLETDMPACFVVPDCPAYWSLDSSGREPLSIEIARYCGFPDICVSVEVWGRFWNSNVYAGIRPFHEAKGFDPDSQDVGMHLGYPLFQLACWRGVLLPHYDDDTESEVVSGGEDHGSLQQKSVEPSGPSSGTESLGVHVQEVEEANIVTEFERMTDDAAASDVVRDPRDLAIKVGLCLGDKSLPDSEAQPTRSNEGISYVAGTCLFHPFDEVEISRSWNVVICVQLILILLLSASSVYHLF